MEQSLLVIQQLLKELRNNKCDFLRTLAIIPVYRDFDNAIKVLGKFEPKIVNKICLVVDSAEKIDVEKVLKRFASLSFQLIRNEKRKGIGYAIKQGIKYARDNKYDVVVILAGNNKDNPKEIPVLLKPILIGNYDYVQGSRFLSGGKCVRNPFLRGVFSRLYPFLWTILTNVQCTDVTNGFRAYKVKLFEDPRIDISQRWLDDYELEYYIHYKVLTLGYKTIEVPVSKMYSHRHKGGYSQISPLRDWWRIVRPLFYLKLGTKQ
jgi:dolichol-phosphate mannosyltransferase